MAFKDGDKKRKKRGPGRPFARGHPGGPGRPPAHKERAFIEVMWTKCPPEQWGEIVDKAVELARDGDRYARDWLGKYLLPSPGAARDVPEGEKLVAALEAELHRRALGGDTQALLASLRALSPQRYGNAPSTEGDEGAEVVFRRGAAPNAEG